MAFSRTYPITSFLFILIPSVASITINLTHIFPQSENLEIVTEGDAPYISPHGIELTPFMFPPVLFAGRATYIKPLHLWDNKSGELTSFSTNFSFVIESNNRTNYGGGLTFFLAQNNSVIAGGRGVGLPVDITSKKTLSRFVAVEFSTLWNPHENPLEFHSDYVGISISSLDFVNYQKWLSSIPSGRECQAQIIYDSTSKNLTVSFTGFQNMTVVYQQLVYTVDLRNELPEWVIFGFSGGTGASCYQSHIVRSWSFHSSDLSLAKKGKNNKMGLIVGVWIAGTILAMLVFLLWMWKKNNKKKKSVGNEEVHGFDIEMNNDFDKGIGPQKFSYNKLAHSTCNFADDQKIGEGGFGSVYKGFFKDSSTYVAVKKVSRSSKQGIKEYASEVRIISRLRHKNLVQLVGWCHENRQLLLVYEFMENGSLDLHLFKGKSLLSWDVRYKISYGLASALLYLHEDCEQCVLHRDIKSSNVMLDSNFNPKLGDFGLAKLVEHEKGSKTTVLAGTMGYMAPECVVSGKVSKESDVYSFGVVTLEIASGRRSIVYMGEETQIRLVEWVWEHYRTKTLVEAADSCLHSDFDKEELMRLMTVGLWCANPNPDLRPSMRQVIQVLKSEASLPKLPSEMPVATYSTPSAPLLYGVTSIVENQLLKLYDFT